MHFCLKLTTSNLSDFSLIHELLLAFGVSPIKIIVLPKRLRRFVFIKSPHVNNSSKEHFQILKHQRLFYVTLSLNSLQKLLMKTPNTLNLRIKKLN